MNQMVVSIDQEKDNKDIIAAIKLFASKNKKTSLVVIGKQKDLVLLEKFSNISLVYSYIEGNVESNYKEDTIIKSLDMLKEKNNKCLISFINKKELYDYTLNKFDKIFDPFYLTRFLTGKNNCYSFIADTGISDDINAIKYLNILKESTSFIEHVFSLNNPTFSILASDDKLSSLDKEESAFYKKVESIKEFNKITSFDQLLEGKSNLYLTNARISNAIIQSIKSIFEVYHNKFSQYIKDDFVAKVSNFFAKKMNQFVFSNTNSYLDRHGSYLLGFEKLIVNIPTYSKMYDIYNSLLNIQKYLNYLTLSDIENNRK